MNSNYNKLNEINKLIDLNDFDVIFLNETKLDESMPNRFLEHCNYNLIRRDRNRNGGGLAVFIKKHYSISCVYVSLDIELLSFKIKFMNVSSSVRISLHVSALTNS